MIVCLTSPSSPTWSSRTTCDAKDGLSYTIIPSRRTMNLFHRDKGTTANSKRGKGKEVEVMAAKIRNLVCCELRLAILTFEGLVGCLLPCFPPG